MIANIAMGFKTLSVRNLGFITKYDREVTLRHSKGERRGLCPHASSASA
nr:hypothetical protein [Mucilaginibacter sp. X4EP1]